MGESISATFAEVFKSRGLALSEASRPDQETAEGWFEGLSGFEQNSYVRLILRAPEGLARVRVELAAGPPEGEDARLADAAAAWLSRETDANWDVSTREMPALLVANLETPAALSATLDALLGFIARASGVTRPSEWFAFFGQVESTTTSPNAESATQPSSEPADTPFETIGHGIDQRTTTARPERLEVTRGEGGVRLLVHLSGVLSSADIDRLVQALSHYVHARYDVQARLASDAVAGSQTLALAIEPDRYLGSEDELVKDLQRFCERLSTYAEAGGDLQDYLGLNEVVLPSSKPGDTYTTPGRRTEAAPATSEPAPSRPTRQDSNTGVVFDLSSASANTAQELSRGNFTDARLQRDDAQTALVDLVLRHPGYSDRRINQVLTILLSIDYAAAERLSESAPCVIAWGVSLERARSFKDVLHTAGARAVLVEPGTFGEG